MWCHCGYSTNITDSASFATDKKKFYIGAIEIAFLSHHHQKPHSFQVSAHGPMKKGVWI
jgi:hypothetical protein